MEAQPEIASAASAAERTVFFMCRLPLGFASSGRWRTVAPPAETFPYWRRAAPRALPSSRSRDELTHGHGQDELLGRGGAHAAVGLFLAVEEFLQGLLRAAGLERRVAQVRVPFCRQAVALLLQLEVGEGA